MSMVVAALDTNPVARIVLETAVLFARLTGTGVEALHVRSSPSDDVRMLEILAARCEVPLRVVQGPAESALCQALGAPKVVAAVIGARATATGRRPVGRTALHVLEQIDKPVLVVPPDAVAPVAIRRLLVPLEGAEESSRSVLEQLGPLLAAEVEITVLHVFTEGTLPTMLDRPVRDLDIWSKEFLTRHYPSAAHIELRLGAVAARVAEVSGEHGADLVVLGWSRNTSAGRAAVVREVLGASALPVLLLPVKRLAT
jgi:nucleotide-binding universal stress UspA family protein